jgi:MFS family permease
MAPHAQRTARPAADRAKFSVLLTASLISSLIMLDSNIVAVSLPAIARSLGAAFTDIEWVVSAYVLTFAALLLAAGSFADRHGRKLTTVIGLAVFTIASGLCGFATSALMLNLSRALQGIGASLLLTAALAVINHAFVGQERAKAYAFWGGLPRYRHYSRAHHRWRADKPVRLALGLPCKPAYWRDPVCRSRRRSDGVE